ncbi:Proline iminopeptidase [Meiothermus luteus]|jgi:proline iminopeptidase|uniref:Proline iminopeptidase n=1 Tax=Meiothermus luteus TaxID=2026184 RepID=A0A399ELM8_9DEIN|nr:alpha/beta hydrolase [Meiothermus luteus]RIH84546.1 Proline iminopeptidase [Meiothermus luteus]RMH56107.1 MAG: alpha/beta fold hydrolase [Deinococcota bacterium]
MREEIDWVTVAEGVEVYLEDTGPREARPLLVLHGGPGGSSYALREGIGDLLEDYRVLYLDQRGGGRSPALPERPEFFTLDALVDDLRSLRRHLGLPEWTLLGHGFGGLLALEYARRWPESTRGLVLVNPWTNFPWLAAQLYRASLALRGLEEVEVPIPEDGAALLEEAFAHLEPKVVFDRLLFPSARSRMEYEWVVEGSVVVGSDAPGRMLVLNGLWRFDYTPYLLDLKVPPQVILGTLDHSSYPEAEVVADLTGGRLELVEGAGHYPWVDQPQTFAEALRSALEG